MENINKTLKNWLKDLDNFKYPSYEDFPDIDLYMDQVVTYLEKLFQVFATSSLDKQITSSMINNYVKGEVISAPIQKKYNKEHLSLIEEICSLKQVLSIAEIKQILDVQYSDGSRSETFNSYKSIAEGEMKNVVSRCNERLEGISENNISELTNLALDFAISANNAANVSKRILFYIKLYQETLENNKKNKEDEKAEEKKRSKKAEEPEE